MSAPVLAFIARDVARWLGIPAGIVIAAMVMLRKRGKQLRARRRQSRAVPPGDTQL